MLEYVIKAKAQRFQKKKTLTLIHRKVNNKDHRLVYLFMAQGVGSLPLVSYCLKKSISDIADELALNPKPFKYLSQRDLTKGTKNEQS
jgi:hypothetical protein